MEARGQLPDGALRVILAAERTEITEHRIYEAIARRISDEDGNRKVLRETAAVELAHYRFFRALTGIDLPPDRLKVALYLLAHRIFGITFTIKLLERGENRIQGVYRELVTALPGLEAILHDEEKHERELIALIDEQRLRYTGSIVLGLNDALVELTGTLAGFTFALQDTRVIAAAGLITGIAAALSMGAAEYLSTKSESDGRDPIRASMYTAIAYILTVLLLIAPYLLLGSFYLSLAVTIVNALLVILIFTFYIAVARDLDFRSRFAEMAAISLGVAALSFLLGVLVRTFLHVDM